MSLENEVDVSEALEEFLIIKDTGLTKGKIESLYARWEEKRGTNYRRKLEKYLCRYALLRFSGEAQGGAK